MSFGDILLLSAVGLWAVWAIYTLIRRRLSGKRCCCSSCAGGCAKCASGQDGKRERMKK